MKKGWKYKPLREVCEVINGLWKGKKPPYAKIGVIRNTNFTKQLTLDFNNIEYIDVEVRQLMKRTLQKGDIIIEKSGGSEKWPVGRACVFYGGPDEKYSFSNFTSVLRVKDPVEMSYEFLHKYLYFIYFRGDTRSMQKAATGIHNIEFDKYLDIQIPIIPLSEQKVIVEKINKVIEKLGSVQANALASLNEAIFLFDSSLNASMNSNNWASTDLKSVCSKIGSGSTPKGGRKVYTKTGCSIIRSLNVHHNYFKYEDLAHITEAAAEALKGVTIKENDVLFNITGASIGRCCVVPADVIPARVNQHVCILRAENFVSPEFLSYQLNSRQHQRELLAIGEAGSTRQALTKKDLEKHIIYYPSPEEQQRIVLKLDSMIKKIAEMQDNLEKVYAECEYLKDSILKQLFN